MNPHRLAWGPAWGFSFSQYVGLATVIGVVLGPPLAVYTEKLGNGHLVDSVPVDGYYDARGAGSGPGGD